MKEKNAKRTQEKGITLIALVVTIVVLLILAGVSIIVLWGDHGILKTAQDATDKFGIETEREKIDNIRIDWWTKKVTGEKVTVQDFFSMLEEAGIIADKNEIPQPNENNTYIIETNSGYIVEIIIDENGNIQIGNIEKGENLGPKIVSFEMIKTTASSITVKAQIQRAGNATIKYEYKKSTESDYIDITDKVINEEVTVDGLTEGSSYDFKVTVTKVGFEEKEKKLDNIIARNITQITQLELNTKEAMVGINTTLNLTATIKPEDATIKELEWKSSNESVATVDNNGIVTTKKIGNTTITAITKDGSRKQANCSITVILADGSFNANKGINIPKLGNGMMAITWDETANEGKGDWVTPNSIDNWYQYSVEDKKWANAITEDGSMWVWIPRYAYQISSGYHKNGKQINEIDSNLRAGEINIQFMKETSNISANNKEDWDNISGENKWNIHPAFEYDVTKPGIWVAKFEASQSDAGANDSSYKNYTGGTSGIIKVQPNVNSWRNIGIGKTYEVCLNYNTDLKSHLIKNTEWGAVAYLAQSNYGKNSEIAVNQCKNLITGAGPNIGDNGIYATSTYEYNASDFDSKYGYTTSQGQKASTTGNIYGIYDLSGCSREYVAAYIENNYTIKDTGLYYQDIYKAIIDGEMHTKNVYEIVSNDEDEGNYSRAINQYGDAIYETSSRGIGSGNSWYDDRSYFPYKNAPFFYRGGDYGDSTLSSSHGPMAGTFHFSSATGWDEKFGFHLVLAP